MADDNQSVEDGNNEPTIQQLRQAAEAGRRAQREVAFLKAGVDTDSPIGKLLFKSYEGDLDIEAIKSAATEVGAIKAPEPPPAAPSDDSGPSPEELAQTRLRNDLASNSGTPSNPDVNPYDEAYSAWEAAKKEGLPAAQRSAAALGPVFAAAARGDRRVLG